MAYKQLAQSERYQIQALSQAGHSQSFIAKQLNRHRSTIYREMKRNTGKRGYRSKQADTKAMVRKADNARRIDSGDWAFVCEKLDMQWSPEQIAHFVPISTSTIYNKLLLDKRQGGKLYLNLRHQKKHKKRYGSRDRRGTIPNRIGIEDRPAIVAERSRIGDWEADTVIGKMHKQALVTLADRKSGRVLIKKVTQKTSALVTDAMIDLLQPFADSTKTITMDNGKEFCGHIKVGQSLESEMYFAHPYSSWERGTNENTNGLIRQYFPKKTDFRTITDEDVQMVMDRLNNRPRKRLGYKTPNEVFFGVDDVALRS